MLVVQGELTERVYFERLKEILHLSNVSIKAVPHSPELIVSRSKQSINRDKNSPFTYVFYVIDVDESSDDQINRAVSEAKESKTKHTQHYVVVSYESFDSWLFAHHRRLCGVHFPRSHIQKELKKLGFIVGKKNICADFPIAEFAQACANSDHLELNPHFTSRGERTCASAMPALIDKLTELG
ncbi:MAG: RloB domain-containing protein [Corynebacterium sp.]|uniref:RloB family protein n=1 Tax=Corynebacterium sp. TaxID=1720 RepID=UPI0026DCB26E|nr:RloB domain-containing protein [Corynebacterium sp.]MDO4761664.1 RloB domain-containing protein [Corynebacterium sp.]